MKKHFKKAAFSLIEVILAMGVFTLAIVALIGLLAPTLSSVNDVVQANRSAAAVTKINGYFDNFAPSIKDKGAFQEIYENIADSTDEYNLYVFTWVNGDQAGGDERMVVTDSLTKNNRITQLLDESVGPILIAVVNPATFNSYETSNGLMNPGDPLPPNVNEYLEGYLAMQVDLYQYVPYGAISSVTQVSNPKSPTEQELKENFGPPVLTFPVAVNR